MHAYSWSLVGHHGKWRNFSISDLPTHDSDADDRKPSCTLQRPLCKPQSCRHACLFVLVTMQPCIRIEGGYEDLGCLQQASRRPSQWNDLVLFANGERRGGKRFSPSRHASYDTALLLSGQRKSTPVSICSPFDPEQNAHMSTTILPVNQGYSDRIVTLVPRPVLFLGKKAAGIHSMYTSAWFVC